MSVIEDIREGTYMEGGKYSFGYLLVENIPISLEENKGHAIGSWGFTGMHLLQGRIDLFLGKSCI